MRRNSTDSKHLKYILAAIALILYLIAGNVYTFLSPLVGVCFVYLLQNMRKAYKNAEDNISIYLIFLYLAFFELSSGFYLFSSALLFFTIYYLLKHRVEAVFKSESWIISIYVIATYSGMYILNNFFSYMQDKEFFHFSFIYIFYMFVDSMVAILLFKKR